MMQSTSIEFAANRTAFAPRDNPFSVHRVTQLPFRFTDGDRDQVIEAWRRHRCRGAIVGRHGTGKSTLLREMGRRLTANACDVIEVVAPHSRSEHSDWLIQTASRCSIDSVLLIDGLERLSGRHRRQLLFRTRQYGLIATLHRRRGLPEIYRTSVSETLARRLLVDLGIDDPPLADRCAGLLTKHRGYLRSLFFDLYDEYSRPDQSCTERAADRVPDSVSR